VNLVVRLSGTIPSSRFSRQTFVTHTGFRYYA
jgi:hypothetical protein